MEREREASRRRRTRCRETEPAGCCSAFKSLCGYSPPHTHTFSHRHALPLTAMLRRLITYLLRCSALKPDALYDYDLFYVENMCFYSFLILDFEYCEGHDNTWIWAIKTIYLKMNYFMFLHFITTTVNMYF